MRIALSRVVKMRIGIALLFFCFRNGTSQPLESPASELIKSLTYQAGRQVDVARASVFTCGSLGAEASENMAIVRSLVGLGSAAISDLESAFESISQHGRQSKFFINASWLLLAYAKIRGPAAYPRLKSMASNPVFDAFRDGLDQSFAVSLGLTSYVSSPRIPVDIICRSQQPRDSLDRLIIAWERNDRDAVESTLGPKGRAGLNALINAKGWVQFRKELWPRAPSGRVAVGYRFDTADRWFRSDEALSFENASVDLTTVPINPDIETRFVDSSGRDCGRKRLMHFLSPQGLGAPPPPYLIDNIDTVELLRQISSCAIQSDLR